MSATALVRFEDVYFAYRRGTPFERLALRGIDLEVRVGESLALMGPTGCGKSTLVQHFNGLLHPTAGRVLVEGRDLSARRTDLVAVRRQVGLLFQFPEHQLFEDTLARDVAYGPRNLGCPADEVDRRVRTALEQVGLPWEKYAERNPYSLSGGEMRRAALAGVLATRPRVLVLDEPTAGLDARGRRHLLAILQGLRGEQGVTLVTVSHDIEVVAALAERLVVMEAGRVVEDGPIHEVLTGSRLEAPAALEVARLLRAGGLPIGAAVVELQSLAQEVLSVAMKQEPAGGP